jgi:uncharacterized membrane protein
MDSHSIGGRLLAIFAGLSFTIGAVVVIFGETLRHPSEWTTYHLITLLTICGTIVVGHLVGSAARAGGLGGWLSAIGFCVLFLAGTGLVIYQSLGRQAEAAGNKAASAEHRNALIASKLQQRDAAKTELPLVKDRIIAENLGWPDAKGRPTKPKGCGTECKGYERQRDAAQALIDRLEREIADLGPQVEVAPELREVQVLRTMFFEFGSIVAFAFGFGHRATRQPSRKPENTRATTMATVEVAPANDLEPMPPKGGNRRRVATKAAAEADVIQLVARGEPIPSQDTLADRWGVHKGTASKWVRDFEARGLIRRQVVGRCKMVAAA